MGKEKLKVTRIFQILIFSISPCYICSSKLTSYSCPGLRNFFQLKIWMPKLSRFSVNKDYLLFLLLFRKRVLRSNNFGEKYLNFNSSECSFFRLFFFKDHTARTWTWKRKKKALLLVRDQPLYKSLKFN